MKAELELDIKIWVFILDNFFGDQSDEFTEEGMNKNRNIMHQKFKVIEEFER